MGQSRLRGSAKINAAADEDSIAQLIAENIALRQIAIELAQQTESLRERLLDRIAVQSPPVRR